MGCVRHDISHCIQFEERPANCHGKSRGNYRIGYSTWGPSSHCILHGDLGISSLRCRIPPIGYYPLSHGISSESPRELMLPAWPYGIYSMDTWVVSVLLLYTVMYTPEDKTLCGNLACSMRHPMTSDVSHGTSHGNSVLRYYSSWMPHARAMPSFPENRGEIQGNTPWHKS